ncbi:MAG: hypothetical protein WBA23_19760, partial [Tunicatimonas sp.]|uniref:hypothetical protein n=1 Tax=Tunicatimonas sp. TaxID=1940096 RepID=UPI003C7624CC
TLGNVLKAYSFVIWTDSSLLSKYEDRHPYFSANWHSDLSEHQDVKHVVDFFTSGQIEYWKMKSHNELITAEGCIPFY